MCVRIRSALLPCPAYDYREQIIRVPIGLCPDLALRAVRGVLAELGAPQPAVGAVCWCGEPIVLDHIPAQRSGEVISSAT